MADVDKILEERGDRYGPFANQCKIAQDMLTVAQAEAGPGYQNLDLTDSAVVDEVLHMICHKVARLMNGNPTYVDGWDDIAGYAKLASKHFSDQQGITNTSITRDGKPVR